MISIWMAALLILVSGCLGAICMALCAISGRADEREESQLILKDTDCSENRTQSATKDACDRLRWLLAQAERVVRVEDADRAAVDRACRLMAECDNGFDRVRG